MKRIGAEELGYPIYLFGDEMEAFENKLLENVFLNTADKKKMIITDQGVYNHHLGLINRLCSNEHVSLYIIPSGENSKSLKMAEKIWSELASSEFHRKDILIALGGGVVGDLTGFVASNYMRGIEWIQIPTTLLAQIDSSVGGKVAVNLPEAKNLVGHFYNPSSVWMCTSFLKTLDNEVFRDGLGEMFKYGYMTNSNLLLELDNFQSVVAIKEVPLGMEKMTELIEQCVYIKMEVVLKDFYEVNERRFLNLGHSFGHAIESYTNYEISHGHAVMLGISWILTCSYLLECRSVEAEPVKIQAISEVYEQLYNKHQERMKKYGFYEPKELTISDLVPYLSKDKKAGGQFIALVLLSLNSVAINQTSDVSLERGSILSGIIERCYIHKWSIVDLEQALSI